MINRHISAALSSLCCAGALIVGAGCSKARLVHANEGATAACTQCHGGLENNSGAPPNGFKGTGTGYVGVGAHSAHVGAGGLSGGFGCGRCHPDPRTGVGGHLNGTVDVVFEALEAGEGAAPTWNGSTCSSTYCHGGFPGGNKANSPTWTRVDGTQAACGTCHGVPPPAPHPQQEDCVTCHPGYSSTRVDASTHVNGAVEVHGLSCTSCHADGSGGAHLRHVRAGAITNGLSCAECHPIPRSMGHSDGTADIQWGVLSTVQGARPSWDGTGCSATYCHGNFAGGNRAYAPRWTGEAASACGTCHGLPPPSPHPSQLDCSPCHDGYTAASVDRSKHLNGSVDVAGTACTSCHGDASRLATVLNPQLAAAPPHGTRGETLPTERAVGAHQLHLAPGAISSGVRCEECHGAIGTTAHANEAVQLSWGSLARTGGVTPSWNGSTCANTYCHGSFKGGNAGYAPEWTRPAASRCGTCHAIPPPAPHSGSPTCALCHAGYTATSVDLASHLNGIVDVSGFTCSSCHGDPARLPTALNPLLAAAPPRGTRGESLPTERAVGAHQRHLSPGTIGDAFACTECHLVPTTIGHADGEISLPFGSLARTGSAAPSWSGTTCSGTYCHGNFRGGSTSYAPDWTRPAATVCGTCHGVPPPAPHPAVPGGPGACSGCHSSSVDTSGNVRTPRAGGTHLDGRLDVAANHGPEWLDTASPQFHAYSANAGIGSCQVCHGQALDGVGGMTSLGCSSCHRAGGPANDFATCTACHGGTSNATGAPPRVIWPGGTSTSLVAVGAHASHVAATHDLSLPVGCESCHRKPATLVAPGHVDGITQVTGYSGTNPDLLAQAGDPGWSSTDGSCSTSYCHGATLQGGSYKQPRWRTVNGSQVTCAGCHGMPPNTGPEILPGQTAHYLHVARRGLDCTNCHPGYGYSAAEGRYVVDPATHVDGKRDATIAGVRREGWTTCSNASCHLPYQE